MIHIRWLGGSVVRALIRDREVASEQVANLQRAQVNSTSYPQRDVKWVVAYGLRVKT